jgi:hypothetical protein
MNDNAPARFKRRFVAALAALLLAVACAATAPTAQAQRARRGRTNAPKAAPVYSCPMHPSDKSRRPGTCPKCGMDLRLAGKGKNAAVVR